MAGAQGAVDSLLGRLTSVLLDEAQLLGGLRGDVEFIRDEMETMNALLRHLTEAQHRNHLVRAWMKQIVGLARDCEGNVELYLHRVGGPADQAQAGNCLLRYLRWLLRLLQSLPARHRIATRIRELKVRARDVGDRRKRYGITVPADDLVLRDDNIYDGNAGQPPRTAAGQEEDRQGRALLIEAAEPPDAKEVVRRGTVSLMKWLSMLPATEDGAPPPQVRVFSIVGAELAYKVVSKVFRQATLFDCQAWLEGEYAVGRLEMVHADILNGICQRFLVAITTHTIFHTEVKRILDALLQAADGCLPGSAIIMTTSTIDQALSYSPDKIIDVRTAHEFYIGKSQDLLGCSTKIADIFQLCYPDTFAMKTFLHLLYINPNRTQDELQHYEKAISECRRLNRSISKQVLLWCYNELPTKYRSCLLYLSIFPEGHVIRTTSLARRWVADGLIAFTTASTPTDDEIQNSLTDEAEHCLDVLFTRGFVSPVEIYAPDNIKSYTVHGQVQEFIARVARDVNFVDSSLPPHLARYLSIHNRIGLQKSVSDGDSKDIATYLPSLSKSPQWQLLKVLDLDGCHGLEKQHLKSICKILLLKYLSLRNTDVAELPKQIKELQCLETLDVRETKVRVLAKKATVLPLLKHFLAGHKVSAANDSTTSEDSFSVVQMPLCIERMNNMEILSHVRVPNSKELVGIAQLLKLRKLVVALHGKHAKLSDLFYQIEKLHKCLRSLSIRIDPECSMDVGMGDPLPYIPEFIERLNISGITSGLRHLISEHHKLTKITLCQAHLEEYDLAILGKLGALHCLKLQHNSYTTGCEIVFRGAEFQSLNYLLVEGKEITKISFASGAAPKLERIVWSFSRMDVLSGLKHLKKLKNLKLNGDCDLDPIERQLIRNPNDPILKHKPNHQRQEDRTAASTSSSSAP